MPRHIGSSGQRAARLACPGESRAAATAAWPKLMAPSFGLSRRGRSTVSPAAPRAAMQRSSSRAFWKVPPPSATVSTPAASAAARRPARIAARGHALVEARGEVGRRQRPGRSRSASASEERHRIQHPAAPSTAPAGTGRARRRPPSGERLELHRGLPLVVRLRRASPAGTAAASNSRPIEDASGALRLPRELRRADAAQLVGATPLKAGSTASRQPRVERRRIPPGCATARAPPGRRPASGDVAQVRHAVGSRPGPPRAPRRPTCGRPRRSRCRRTRGRPTGAVTPCSASTAATCAW